MTSKQILIAGAALGGISVMIGAFGAHALKPMLQSTGLAATFELGVRYQFYHALALLFVGLWAGQNKTLQAGSVTLFFLAGIVLFSGSLYVYSLTANSSFAMVTPVGGIFFLGGWALLIWKLIKHS